MNILAQTMPALLSTKATKQKPSPRLKLATKARN